MRHYCPDCGRFYDDESRWVTCPHRTLDQPLFPIEIREKRKDWDTISWRLFWGWMAVWGIVFITIALIIWAASKTGPR